MSISSSIFKSYDVRGVYPGELNEEAARLIGRSLAQIIGQGRIVIGRDMRLSSPLLHDALVDGLLGGGIKIDDIGEVPIDAVYFTVGKFGYDAGVMITASHNPPEYNGFKIVRTGVQWVRGRDLKEMVENVETRKISGGSINNFDIWSDYLHHVKSFVDVNELKPLKIVIDAGNGMAGKVIPKLFTDLPFKLISLFFELDGSFPNRQSNPLLPKAADVCATKVRELGADVGVMFDGDTDRIFFLDETGKFVPADVTLLLLAKEVLNKEPGAAIAHNLICSRAVPEFIAKWGGKPLRTPVGYVNVSKVLKEHHGVMGGELSAHYSFRDNYYADSGFIALLLVLELLSKTNRALSDLVKEYSPYYKLPEINLQVSDQQGLIKKVSDFYKDARQDDLDGITIQYNDWWVNVRPSNTEPLLRVTLEAANNELLEQKRQEILNLLKD